MRESLNYYRCDLNGYQSLSHEASVSLGQRLAGGDQTARELLIKSGLKLVYRLAQEYQHMLPDASTITLNDLIQEGNIGLIHAVDTFDYKREVKFSHYAYSWILHGIRHCLKSHLHAVHVPVSIITDAAKLRKLKLKLSELYGQEPSLEQLATAFGKDIKYVNKVLQASDYNTVYLSAKIGLDTNSKTLGDQLPDENWIDTFEVLADRHQLERYFAILSNKELDLVFRYFGFDGPEHSLSDLSRHYGLCCERVRQSLKKILYKLRRRAFILKRQEKN